MRKFFGAFFTMALLTTGCIDAFLGPAPSQDRSALFDDVWHDFDLHYSFFEYNHINWDSLGAAYRPQAVAAATDPEFAFVVGRMLTQLRDVHSSLTTAGSGSTVRYVSPWDTVSTFFDAAFVFAHYIANDQYSLGRHMHFGMAAATVGYMYIPDFMGSGWASEMDAVLNALPNARSLIVDIRNNNGGNNTLAINVAGRFADQKRTYGYVRLRNGPAHGDFTDDIPETVEPMGAHQFSGPVYVLTNRRDFSSAEDFVLAMRVLPQVLIVGDTTAGASGGPSVRNLANGWTYQISEWKEYTPNHKMFEGVGLPPDRAVKAAATDAKAGVDAVLALALRLAAK